MPCLSPDRWIADAELPDGPAIFDVELQGLVVRHLPSADLAKEIAAALNDPSYAVVVSRAANDVVAAVRSSLSAVRG